MLLLILLGMLVLLGGVGAAVYFKVPQRLGLVQSPAAQAFSGTPDRQAASAVKQELAKAGIDTIGMEIFVLPVTGKESSVAYALLDAGQGFRFKSGAGRDVLIDYMTRVGSSEAAKQSGVDRVALEYRGKNGQKLVSLTATTETISGFAKGTLSRPQFLQKLDGDANWPAFYQETMEVFN